MPIEEESPLRKRMNFLKGRKRSLEVGAIEEAHSGLEALEEE